MSAGRDDGAYFVPLSGSAPRAAPLRHMLWLAWVLSVLYVSAGALLAMVNKVTHGQLERVSVGMNGFAVSFLHAARLWDAVAFAHSAGRIDGWQLQILLIALSVALIFAYALTLGLLLSGVRALWARRSR